jgi:hypothetical protein
MKFITQDARMKSYLVGLFLGLAVVFVGAQEQLSSEQLENAMKILKETNDGLKDLPLKVELNIDKPFGIKGHENVGLIVVPDKALTAEVISKAGKEIVPVGQLWMRGVVPAKEGKAVSSDKLRHLTVSDGKKDTRVELYLLGARRGEKTELVIYADGKEPLLVLPLEAGESGQNLPIEVAGKGEKDNEESAALILKFLGKYKATMPIRIARD